MDISPVSTDDLNEIFFLEQSIEAESAASLETLRTRRQMFGDGFLAARINGRIMGYVETCLWDLSIPQFDQRSDFFTSRHSPHGKILYVIFLGVAQNSRRQGVASSLLDAVIKVANQYGVKVVQAVTRQYLLPLYLQNGFTIIRDMPNFLPDAADFHLMEHS
jgi:ribosomal protein S18 acetylase RimI-like enzyme